MKRLLFISFMLISATGFAQEVFSWSCPRGTFTVPIQSNPFRSKSDFEEFMKNKREKIIGNSSGLERAIVEKVWEAEKEIWVTGYNAWNKKFQTPSTETHANEIFERNKETVAANNEYTRNIGPRNGWDDTKTGTTIIRETNEKTNVIKPRDFKPVEEPSETPKNMEKGGDDDKVQRAARLLEKRRQQRKQSEERREKMESYFN